MVRAFNYELEPIDVDGNKIREVVINRAIELLEREKLEIPAYADDEIINFALEWQGLSGLDTKRVRGFLNKPLKDGITPLEWVFENYSLDRLFCLYEFTVYCEWISVSEIIRHFGDFLRVFMTLQGKRPDWYDGPFHLVLKVSYSELWRRYRTYVIREWLKANWKEAEAHFENNVGTLSSLPKVRDLEYKHVYTQYKKMKRY